MQATNIIVNTFPRSAQVVYQILQRGRKLYVDEIQSMSNYSFRMVRYALRYLLDADLILQIKDLEDMRRHFYTIRN